MLMVIIINLLYKHPFEGNALIVKKFGFDFSNK